MSDPVNHPAHYASSKIETLEFIEDKGLGHHLACVVKYCSRAGAKDPSRHIEDLEKAAFYLARKIELLKAARDNREPCRPNDMNKQR